MKELKLKDASCLKRLYFLISEDEDISVKEELDSFSKKKSVIKKLLVNILEFMYNNSTTDEYVCKRHIMKILESEDMECEENLVQKVYQLAKRDHEQSAMYNKKAFNQSFKFIYKDFCLIYKVDKFEKNTEKGIYRVTMYSGSTTAVLKDLKLVSALLINEKNVNICSYQVKSYTKADGDFLGEGDRSETAIEIEEPYMVDINIGEKDKKVLNMPLKSFSRPDEVFKQKLVEYSQEKINNLQNIEEFMNNVPTKMKHDYSCTKCKYKRYCLN